MDGIPLRGPCASARPVPGRLVLGVGTKSMAKKMTEARIRFFFFFLILDGPLGFSRHHNTKSCNFFVCALEKVF